MKMKKSILFLTTSFVFLCLIKFTFSQTALLVCDFDNTFTCKDGEMPSSSSGTTFTTGYRNQGAYLDSTNDYLYYPASGNVLPSEGTITFWYKPTYNGAPTDDPRFFFNIRGTGSPNLYSAHESWDPYYFVSAAGNPVWCGIWTPTTDWVAGAWYHLAFSWDADAGVGYSWKLWRNGSQWGYLSSCTWTPPSYDNIGFCSHVTGYGDTCRGTIDEVRVFSRVLTDSEVQQVMNTGAYADLGESCSSPGECLSGNCAHDYDDFDAWCCNSGQCAHNGICYNDGESSGSYICRSGVWKYTVEEGISGFCCRDSISGEYKCWDSGWCCNVDQPNEFWWPDSSCGLTTTTTSSTSTSTTSTTPPSLEFEAWLSTERMVFRVGRPFWINIYIKNIGNQPDTYNITDIQISARDNLGNDVSHLVNVRSLKNTTDVVYPDDVTSLSPRIVVLTTLGQGSKITFTVTSNTDPSQSKDLVLNILSGLPESVPEISLFNIFMINLIVCSIMIVKKI